MSDGPSRSEIAIVLSFLGIVISRSIPWLVWPSILALLVILLHAKHKRRREMFGPEKAEAAIFSDDGFGTPSTLGGRAKDFLARG